MAVVCIQSCMCVCVWNCFVKQNTGEREWTKPMHTMCDGNAKKFKRSKPEEKQHDSAFFFFSSFVFALIIFSSSRSRVQFLCQFIWLCVGLIADGLCCCVDVRWCVIKFNDITWRDVYHTRNLIYRWQSFHTFRRYIESIVCASKRSALGFLHFILTLRKCQINWNIHHEFGYFTRSPSPCVRRRYWIRRTEKNAFFLYLLITHMISWQWSLFYILCLKFTLFGVLRTIDQTSFENETKLMRLARMLDGVFFCFWRNRSGKVCLMRMDKSVLVIHLRNFRCSIQNGMVETEWWCSAYTFGSFNAVERMKSNEWFFHFDLILWFAKPWITWFDIRLYWLAGSNFESQIVIIPNSVM